MINVSKLYFAQPRFPSQSLSAYLVAGSILVVATALRMGLGSWIAGMPYVAYFPAVIAITILCGSETGFLAILLSILLARFFVLPPDATYLFPYQTALFGVGSCTVLSVAGAMRAVTADVRRLNNTLRLGEERFRGLLESAPDAMVIVDERHRIVLINARTEILFGYRRAELLGKTVEMLVPERNRKKYLAALSAAMTAACGTPMTPVIDLQGLRQDSTEIPIEVSLGPLKTATGILVSSAIRDITARRQMEAGLIEASRAKSDFLAKVSHELRTPLNAIIGFSELIRDAHLGPVDAKYREYAGDINDSGRHLQSIVNDILDISKIEAGRLELRDEIVSVGETVAACRRIVAAMAEAAGVTLSIRVAEFLPPIRSDQVRFKQILLNLMSNAVKFTPAGGCVTVSAVTEGDCAVIVVEDTGIGMKTEDIAIALQPFRQIDGALSRRFDGTGLGLSLANALVELHGGRLDIESAPAKGTVVRIRLPMERMANVAA